MWTASPTYLLRYRYYLLHTLYRTKKLYVVHMAKTTVNGNRMRTIIIFEIGVIIIFILSMLIPNAIYVFIELRKKRISNGQLCLTNTDVQKVSLQNLLKHLDRDPSQKFVSISQNDGRGYFCSCEKCEQINNIEQSKSGTLLRYLNFRC